MITITLIYTRKLVRGEHAYLYRVTSYRNKGMRKEVMKDNASTLQNQRNRSTARRVLDSAPYIMNRFSEDFGFQDTFIDAVDDLTNKREAGRCIVILAAMTATGSFESIELHTGMKDGKVS